jgi:hypothetical protein
MVLPGLNRCGFLTPPVDGGRRGPLAPKMVRDRRLLTGALPPTDILAVCLVLDQIVSSYCSLSALKAYLAMSSNE